jgi:hypothetical protein
MLIQLLVNHPQALGTIVKNTPIWVWGLLAALLALGFSQARARTAGLARIALMPVAMTGFSLSGVISGFGTAPQFASIALVWLASAALLFALIAPGPAAGRYDAATHVFTLPGTLVPLALIVAIFLTKYVVGVEMAMQPHLVRDTAFTLPVAAIYGAFSGIFAGRAARLLRLAMRPAPAGTQAALQS